MRRNPEIAAALLLAPSPGVIHSSKDLAEWPVSADFTVPGLPDSLEILDGRFHVGLSMCNAATTVAIEPVGPESGSIWRTE